MEYLNTAQELLDFIMRWKMDIQNWRRQKNGVSFRAENIM